MRLIVASLFLCIFALCNSTVQVENGIVKVGHEVDYKYEITVRTGTKQPAESSSFYVIHSTLHIQGIDKDVLAVYLSDITHHASTSKNDADQKDDANLHWEPLPAEATALQMPFKIMLDTYGKVKSVIFEKTDVEWSMNIKKSLASILQIDRQQVLESNQDRMSRVANVDEDTIYGVCNVQYEISHYKDNYFTLYKTQDPKMCQNKYHMDTAEHIMSTESNRWYKYDLTDGYIHIGVMTATGNLILAPQRARSEEMYMMSKQKMTFKTKHEISEKIQIKEPIEVTSLKYEEPVNKCRETSVTAVYDVTGGRQHLNYDKLIERVDSLLTTTVEHFYKNHLTLTKANMRHVQSIENLLVYLEHFDLPTMERMHALLEDKNKTPEDEKKMSLFVLLLPHVGSRTSLVFLRNLIRKEKINDFLIASTLVEIPNHVRCPNEKLLVELADMLTIGKDDIGIHSRSVLAFASLIRKTFEHFDEKSPILEKYIEQFTAKVLDSNNDYRERVLYLEALSNIHIGSVVDKIIPMTNSKTDVPSDLRSMALWSIGTHVTHDSKLLMKVVWPILTNRLLDVEYRLIAYFLYVKYQQPSLYHFMRLHYWLQNEHNEKIYYFHYNTMKSFLKMKCTGTQCKLVDIARTILRLSRRPLINNPQEGYLIANFFDFENSFGARIDSINFLTPRESTVKSRLSTSINGMNFEMINIHFRIKTEGEDLSESSEEALANKGKISYDLVIRRHGRTIFVDSQADVYMSHIMETITTVLKSLLPIDEKSLTSGVQIFSMPFKFGRLFPSDVGVPVLLSGHLPSMSHVKASVDTVERILNVDFRYKASSSRLLILETYNPIINVFHGMQQIRTVNSAFAMSATGNKLPDGLKFSFNKFDGKDKDDNIAGLQVYVSSEVFVRSLHNLQCKEVIKKFNKDAESFEPVTKGVQYKKDFVLIDKEVPEIGNKVEIKIFDCEEKLSYGTIMTMLENMGDQMHFHETNSVTLFLQKLSHYLYFTPTVGTCGIGVRFTPLENVKYVNLAFNNVEALVGSHKGIIFQSGFDFATNGSLKVLTNDDKKLSEINFSTGLYVQEFHRNALFKWASRRKHMDVEKCHLNVNLQWMLDVDKLDVVFEMIGGEANKPETALGIHIKGQHSDEEQRMFTDKKMQFDECQPTQMNNFEFAPVTLECARTSNQLRKYVIDMKTSNEDDNAVSWVIDEIRNLKSEVDIYATEVKQPVEEVKENITRFELNFPVFRKEEVDITVTTSDETYIYKGIPYKKNDMLYIDDILPIDLFYSGSLFENIKEMVRVKTCILDSNVKVLNANYMRHTHADLTEDWTPYLHREKQTIFVKKMADSQLAFKVKTYDSVFNQTRIMEVMPKGDAFVFNVDDKEVPVQANKYYVIQHFTQMLWTEQPKLVRISFADGLHVLFTGKQLRFDASVPRKAAPPTGKCFETNA